MKLFKSVSVFAHRHIQQLLLWSALLGLFASMYLLLVYVSGAPIVCGIVSGCDTVRASAWAYIYGIPRPLFGVIFYLGIIFMLMLRTAWPRWRPVMTDRIALLLAVVGVLESGQLTLVEWLDIKAFCMWCLVSAFATVLVLIWSFFIPHERPQEKELLVSLKRLFVGFAIGLIVGALGLRILWVNGEGRKSASTPSLTASQMQLLVPDGMPVEGPATSTVTVVEFVDFQCPSCREFHPILQRIRTEYAGKIRFVQRMYPLTEIHPFALEAAVASVCAGLQHRYFEYTDSLMTNPMKITHADLLQKADALGLDRVAFTNCLVNPEVMKTVSADRKQGQEFGIKSTPTTLVNATLLEGVPTYEDLKKVIDAQLTR